MMSCAPATGLDYVTIRQGEGQKELRGKVEVEAADGGLLFLTQGGAYWLVQQSEIVSRRSDETLFTPFSRQQLSAELAAELKGFRTHETKHYLILYNTSAAYAEWVGALFERLHDAFYNFWSRSGVALREPEFPLVALVFDSQASYAEHARHELGEATASIIGYYSLTTNRMTMYDLTGVEQAAGGRSSPARINQILSQPRAERTVATIVHEATHQIAFNSGLQVRFADVPFWLSEGIAIYFETPDLKRSKGWGGIGAVNRVNLLNFRKYLETRPRGSLAQLLSDDKRFRDPKTSADAYAEAWALNYFLIRTRKAAYIRYLQDLAALPPQRFLEPDERIAQFRQHFGDDLDALEAEFLKHMRGVN
jgi:hypothetical protein